MASRPRIAVTMGDPAGIGPELCLKLLTNPAVAELCVPVVFGSAAVLRRVAKHLHVREPECVIERSEWPRFSDRLAVPAVLDLQAIDADALEPGAVSAACGKAAYAYFTFAIDEALGGYVDAIATAPISKEALHAAGFP